MTQKNRPKNLQADIEGLANQLNADGAILIVYIEGKTHHVHVGAINFEDALGAFAASCQSATR